MTAERKRVWQQVVHRAGPGQHAVDEAGRPVDPWDDAAAYVRKETADEVVALLREREDLFFPRLSIVDQPDHPERLWRYYVQDARGRWVGTVFLDSRGTIVVHSLFGPLGYDWPEIAPDPRAFFREMTEDDDAEMVARFIAWRPTIRTAAQQIVRVVFPRWRGMLRREHEREQAVTDVLFPHLRPLPTAADYALAREADAERARIERFGGQLASLDQQTVDARVPPPFQSEDEEEPDEEEGDDDDEEPPPSREPGDLPGHPNERGGELWEDDG